MNKAIRTSRVKNEPKGKRRNGLLKIVKRGHRLAEKVGQPLEFVGIAG